jgi:signal transduction histidine kinase
MGTVSILWGGVAGIALALAGVHGTLWALERRGLANLALCAVGAGVAGLAVTELGMMHSASAAEYGEWVRWFHVPNFLTVAGLVLFVHLQFGGARVWLAGMVTGLRGALLLVNFIVHPNVNWSEISSLRTLPFLGEDVSVIGAAVVRGPVQWAASLASLLFIVYVADALFRAWRRGDRETRRRALVICGAILAFITLAILESQLVVWGVVRMPVVVAPPFLILVAAITYELGRGLVASARLEREAQRLRDELAHVARVNTVSQLSGALAHELKQPLTAIAANAQAARAMLAAGKLDEAELDAILADICSDDLRADAIIERTRMLMKRGSIELREVSIAAITRDVLALVRADAIKRGVTLEASVPDAMPEVRADRVQLSQVLLNLVVNAMDAVAARAAPERRVRIEARRGDDHVVEIAVVDSGTGIPGELLPRIFDSFVTTKPAGLGIGLAVSKAIMEAHGGALRCENNPDRGATFRFTLRAAPRGG